MRAHLLALSIVALPIVRVCVPVVIASYSSKDGADGYFAEECDRRDRPPVASHPYLDRSIERAPVYRMCVCAFVYAPCMCVYVCVFVCVCVCVVGTSKGHSFSYKQCD